jgi:hypothetical protein
MVKALQGERVNLNIGAPVKTCSPPFPVICTLNWRIYEMDFPEGSNRKA